MRSAILGTGRAAPRPATFPDGPLPARAPEAGSAGPASRPRPPGVAPPGRPPSFARAAGRPTEGRAAAVLLALWVGLWAVFTLGVLAPAAAVHAVAPAAAGATR